MAIDSGASSSTTLDGVTYQADKYATGGNISSTTNDIAGVADGTLYKTERYGDFTYSIPVTAGTYSIELHMAEIYWEAAGERSFSVAVENQTEIADLDLYSQAGHDGAFNHIVENVRVTDGSLDIKVSSTKDGGTLAGFAIWSADGALDTSVPEPEPQPNCSGYVAITYDDGPANTNAFVNSLKQNGLTPVTWFVNGSAIQGNTAAIQQMLSVGYVESHSYDHVDMNNYSYQQVADQLQRNNQAIQNAGAPKPTIFRPPYGSTGGSIRSAASDLGLLTVTWDVDSNDWAGASTSDIVNAASRLQNGQIILMHENQPNSLAAIPQIAQNLRSKGLCPGRISASTGRAVAP